MPKHYYKFLNLKNGKITSMLGNQTWEIGKEYSVTGKVKKCGNGFHASAEPLDALSYVKGDVLAIVTVSGDSDNDTDKVCYRNMTIKKAYKWTPIASVTLAIYAAEQVVKIYEDKYPNDTRPRDAIKAAKAYLKNPSKDAAYAAYAAADAAYAAADAAADAAYAARAAAYAAYAAYAAAYAADAAYAAYAARAAAYAAYAARAAAYAADAAYAARAAAYAEMTAKINRKFKSIVKTLEEIK